MPVLLLLIIPITAGLIPWVINWIIRRSGYQDRYEDKVAVPRRILDKEINTLEKQIGKKVESAQRLKTGIERQYGQMKALLEVELSELNTLLEKCKAHRDV